MTGAELRAELSAGVSKMKWLFFTGGLTFPKDSPSSLHYMLKTLRFPA